MYSLVSFHFKGVVSNGILRKFLFSNCLLPTNIWKAIRRTTPTSSNNNNNKLQKFSIKTIHRNVYKPSSIGAEQHPPPSPPHRSQSSSSQVEFNNSKRANKRISKRGAGKILHFLKLTFRLCSIENCNLFFERTREE